MSEMTPTQTKANDAANRIKKKLPSTRYYNSMIQALKNEIKYLPITSEDSKKIIEEITEIDITEDQLKDYLIGKERNFINPPYSRQLKEAFIRKAFEESRKGKVCVMLLPVSTSTNIFHDIILPNAEIRFVRGRISFEGVNTFGKKVVKGSAPMHDSMVVIFKQSEEGKARHSSQA